jgi:hypothetical protein
MKAALTPVITDTDCPLVESLFVVHGSHPASADRRPSVSVLYRLSPQFGKSAGVGPGPG